MTEETLVVAGLTLEEWQELYPGEDPDLLRQILVIHNKNMRSRSALRFIVGCELCDARLGNSHVALTAAFPPVPQALLQCVTSIY
ncbi:hypothetical protein A2160_05780 [Candidatus Beckwithbacteria bacterium RBG_13_42_9]|uniref:Uncharacterized protein n=1 Tax=Candidatus Beckwithbacteria bacterium RBG_13_42_9 TaxID=1797457 RepID=A0A1F5E633_9BACT|nr:MAG: hypothetical protein A2160_05780 [Candidatus Beckwithbacteria bacterium RBG_13_42_9]